MIILLIFKPSELTDSIISNETEEIKNLTFHI